jgi:nitrite reductase (NADH) small subunit
MNESRWIRVTTRDNVPPREGRPVSLPGCDIALFNLGDRFLAIENRCPHQGGPLADGIVSGCAVVCPLHAWRISLETGTIERPGGTAGCVRTFATRLDGEVILIELPPTAMVQSIPNA